MFMVLLRFAENRDAAGQFVEGHKAWLRQGFEEGVFLLAGSLQPEAGGAILAEEASLSALEARVQEDPFVAERVVSAEVIAFTPSRADPRLEFLLG